MSGEEKAKKEFPKEVKGTVRASSRSKQNISENDVFMTECSDLDKMFQSGALKKRQLKARAKNKPKTPAATNIGGGA